MSEEMAKRLDRLEAKLERWENADDAAYHGVMDQYHDVKDRLDLLERQVADLMEIDAD